MDGIEFLLWGLVGVLIIICGIAMFSYDTRYDECEKQFPKTSEYRECVRQFQQDDADTALIVTTITLAAMPSTY